MAPSILGLASAILGIPTITTFIQNLISALTRNSEYIENVQCTRNQLQEFEDEDLLDKMSILLTPTGYSDGSLNTVIPPYAPSYIENVPFVTSEWVNLVEGWSIDETNNKLVAEATWTGINKRAQYQIPEMQAGKTVKFSFDAVVTAGKFHFLYPFPSGDFGYGSPDFINQSGSYSFTYVATGSSVYFRNKSTDFAGEITNIRVEVIEEADFDFSRGSSATRVNEQGLVEDVQILSGELVQNGNFEEIGSELITNGDFSQSGTPSSNSYTLGWYSPDDGVSISNGELSLTKQSNLCRAYATDGISSISVLTSGKTYKLVYTVTEKDEGAALRYYNGTYINLDGSVGTHTVYYKATTQYFILLNGSDNKTIKLDNVSVKEVGQNWTFGTSWSMGDGVAISDGNASYLTASGSSRFIGGKKYRVSLEIVEYNSGTISLPFDGAGGNANYQNSVGVKTADIIVINNNSPIYIYSSAFNGTIDNVSVIEITDDTDLPRIDYSPYSGAGTCGHLLLEPQRTNLFLYSEDFSTWNKLNNVVVTDNFTTSPDGTQNASKFTFDGTSNSRVEKPVTTTIGNQYTFSIWLKNDNLADPTQVWIGNSQFVQGEYVTITNEWQRYTTTQTADGTTEYPRVNVNQVGSIFAWGAQFEESSYATSYIPTSGTTVTRSAEIANNSGNADLFNDSEGVLYAEVERFDNDTDFLTIGITDGTNDNQVSFKFRNFTNGVWGNVVSGGVNQAQMQYTASDLTTLNKLAIKYKANDFALWFNGVQVLTDTSGVTPTGLKELAFDNGTGGAKFVGKTKALAVFKEALSNNDLELLTGEGYNSFAALAAASNYNVI